MKQISTPLCNLMQKPNLGSSLESQLLFGENVEIINKNNHWIFCRSMEDNYKGWVKSDCIGEIQNQNFQISSPMSYIFTEPNIKSQTIARLFFNSKLKITNKNKTWFECNYNGKKGYVYAKHLIDISYKSKNKLIWVEKAKQFLDVIYLWGGKSCLGLDCSALVQLAVQSSQISFPRNSNDQFHSKILKETSMRNLKKGVLIFWDGHVAIAINNKDIIHANAFHMKVQVEPFLEAKKRIEDSYGKILGFKEFNF